jgi:hypothetical protein
MAGWPCVIVSDQLVIRGYSDPKAWIPGSLLTSAPAPISNGPAANMVSLICSALAHDNLTEVLLRGVSRTTRVQHRLHMYGRSRGSTSSLRGNVWTRAAGIWRER